SCADCNTHLADVQDKRSVTAAAPRMRAAVQRKARQQRSGSRTGTFPARQLWVLHQESEHMLKNTRVQMIAMLAIGAALRFVAASNKLDVFGRANGEQSRQSAADKETGPSLGAPCCSEGLAKGQLLALAETQGKEGAAKGAANGKKPNILFIMGDD